ncbi:hypothetical protein ACE1CD_24245 [Aerosakkonema sp. BLCC-F183]|uniref:hypothetical protein n=1 Tax=Aerosakkonema sp. BLCC-F183 TaxID=3342834 RepID=UPI0035BAEC1D
MISLIALTNPQISLAQTRPNSRPTPTNRPAPARPTARNVVQAYFDDITKRGSSGVAYWCSSSSDFVSTFYAPRAYRILSSSIYGNGGSFVVQLEASNRGGSPVIANWNVYVDKEKSREAAKKPWLPGGYCIKLISEVR